MVRETGQGTRWRARAPGSSVLRPFNSAQAPFTSEMFRVRAGSPGEKDFDGGKVDLPEQARDIGKGSKEESEAGSGADWNSPEEELVNW